MRIIWYMFDGLTPCMIRSFNNKGGRGYKDFAPYNYVDELSKNSFLIENCYGFGETMASVASMITGKDPLSLNSDMPMHPDSYHQWPTIADYLKKKGLTTIFYRNFPLDGLRRKGPYKRFNALESKGYDNIVLEDDVVLLSESKVIKEKGDFFLLNSKKSTFTYIHDLRLHDHHLVVRHGTKKGLIKAIKECTEQVKKNLSYLKYNEKKDILIFSSDHGMTLGPYDDIFFDKNLPADKIESYWPKLIADFKLKTCFFIKGPGIRSGRAKGIFEIRDMFATALDFLKIKHKSKGAISAKSHTRNSSLVSTFRPYCEELKWNDLYHWFHSYIVYIKDSKKWVYRKSKKISCYLINLELDCNEDNHREIEFTQFPSSFRKYINKYFSTSRVVYRLFYAYNPKRLLLYLAKRIKGIIANSINW